MIDIKKISTINFGVFDANNWPGALDYFANDTWKVINFPYQIFGVSEIKFYDLLAENSSLGIYFKNLSFDCVAKEANIVLDKFDVNITEQQRRVTAL